jgi:hypothetical protein
VGGPAVAACSQWLSEDYPLGFFPFFKLSFARILFSTKVLLYFEFLYKNKK